MVKGRITGYPDI